MTFMQMMNNQMQQVMQGMRRAMQQTIVAQQQHQQQQAAPAQSNGSFQNRLDERCFRRLDRFSNKNGDWKEWCFHFLTVIGECNSEFAEFFDENETKEDQIDCGLDIPPEFVELSAQFQSRLINLTTKSVLRVVESTQGNGCEAWRVLPQTFDPMIDARFASLLISTVGYEVAKNADAQASLVTWEGAALRLEKDHKETLSDQIRRALLLDILLATIQPRAQEHLASLTIYEEAREKVISLFQVAKGPGDVDWQHQRGRGGGVAR